MYIYINVTETERNKHMTHDFFLLFFFQMLTASIQSELMKQFPRNY